MRTGRRRKRGSSDLRAWARRQAREDEQRRKVGQAIAWGPLPAKRRPEWLRLGAGFVEQGKTGPVLFVIGIRPGAAGGWELMGHRTCNRWYGTGEVTSL